jgi:hypothetical protein
VPDLSLAPLRQYLLDNRNADGGWGYYGGKTSRLEPTCWALLALGSEARPFDVLRRWPATGGLLFEHRGGEPNFGFHGVALLTLRALGVEHETGNVALIRALEHVRGTTSKPSPFQRQDNSLQAWPWIAETFSWLEPTAWCLLALKKWSRAPGVSVDGSRIDVAERVMIDRCCATGGWNYGNSNMNGQQLKAFVPTTAVALLAMQDRPSEDAVKRSRQYLAREASSERSGIALSLALLSLTASGADATAVRDALVQQIPITLGVANMLSVALTMYALERGVGNAGAVAL